MSPVLKGAYRLGLANESDYKAIEELADILQTLASYLPPSFTLSFSFSYLHLNVSVSEFVSAIKFLREEGKKK